MTMGYAEQAIQSALDSEMAFCKFLSANDTGATGGHQSGILISKTAVIMLFSPHQLMQDAIPKRNVKIRWQNDFVTDSCFTYYESKKELRITRFGRGFPFLKPEQTGTLFVFTKQSEDCYSCYLLETEEEIEDFLNAFAISPAQTNRLIDIGKHGMITEKRENDAFNEFIDGLTVDFPTSEDMSAAAIFDGNDILYSAQAVTEGNKKPDFIFPSQEAYHNFNFPVDSIISLAAKTTCKDRWRQVLNEADRLRDKPKFLCTMQQGISGAQMDEM